MCQRSAALVGRLAVAAQQRVRAGVRLTSSAASTCPRSAAAGPAPGPRGRAARRVPSGEQQRVAAGSRRRGSAPARGCRRRCARAGASSEPLRRRARRRAARGAIDLARRSRAARDRAGRSAARAKRRRRAACERCAGWSAAQRCAERRRSARRAASALDAVSDPSSASSSEHAVGGREHARDADGVERRPGCSVARCTLA